MGWFGADPTVWSSDSKNWFCACGRQGGGADETVARQTWEAHLQTCPVAAMEQCIVCRREFVPTGEGETREVCRHCLADETPSALPELARVPTPRPARRPGAGLTVDLRLSPGRDRSR